MLDQIIRLWKELGINQRVSIIFALLGIVVVTVGLLIWANRPRMQLLYGGLDSKDMADVTSSVEGLGVDYEIRSGGSAIYVDSNEVYNVRMQLASEGIPSGGGVGYEIFDSGSFGVSSFVQHTNFVRAIQGELSRTINQLDGVRSSKVMIVIPENELLINGPEKKPTASVFVDTGSRTLGLEAVDSIRSLVSNAVEGMNPNDVAVVDNRGNVVSAALKDDGTVGMTAGQIKYRKSLEDYYSKKVESMLAKVVGADNVVVRVSVGLDMDMQTLVEEHFDPDNQVVRRENSSENQVVSTETVESGAVGEESNVLGGADNNNPRDNVLSNSNETKKVKDTTYEISKRTVETVKNPGGIRNLNAAVFMALRFEDNGQGVLEPRPRTQEQLDRIRQMVVNALGVEYETEEEMLRRVTIDESEFRAPSYLDSVGGGSTFGGSTSIIDLFKNVVAIGISLFMLLFFFRMIKNASSTSNNLEVLPPDEDVKPGVPKDITPTVSPELLNELIKQNPDKVSSALRTWAFPDQ